jgi:hypothetical protein
MGDNLNVLRPTPARPRGTGPAIGLGTAAVRMPSADPDALVLALSASQSAFMITDLPEDL